ncbi:MAG: Type 1 glutamine amidotransferase-like domain-containing protein, partial [Xanthomonadales bacterium]|nr:Type 1 glutamine amidotransferase-like domain-containing protein [Xanthomonadales bacterium]
PLADLGLYARAEAVFAREAALRDLQRERQEKLRGLQELYRMRLEPTLAAARRLLRADAAAELLQPERKSAIAQLRALDRHHLRRIQTIHREFDRRRAELPAPFAVELREQVHQQVRDAGLVLIAGGHVAVLLNRIRLFRLDGLLAEKPLIAWSAGAMVLCERIVLYHQHAPQGRRDAEVLDAGLGIVRGRVLLPHARTRLDWSNRKRLSLFSQRFAPAQCCTLDEDSMIQFENGRLLAAAGTWTISRKGRRRGVASS